MGNHAVAGIVTGEFLDFSAGQGNYLRIVGLKEALDAFREGKIGRNGVPNLAHYPQSHAGLRPRPSTTPPSC